MEFGVLGPLEVLDGDQPVLIRRGIPRLLLLALILRVGETVSAESLADLVWGDEQPANPPNALQTQVSYLRKALRSVSGATGDVIVTRPGGYALDVPPEHVDAVRFQRGVERARRQAHVGTRAALEAALDEFDRALALWRGDPLADSAGHHFAVGEATRLEELRLGAVEARLDCLLALGRHSEAASDLGALVSAYPLREHFHEQLMLALYRSGRQADALRAYSTARAVLADELGLDPGPELQRMERLVLEQSEELSWVTPWSGDGSSLAPQEVSVTDRATARGYSGNVPVPVSRLIGRERDAARVADLLHRGRLVTLTGSGGAGKTSLAIEVAGSEASHPAWFVDLGSVTEDEAVSLAVAAGLRVPTQPAEDPVDALAGALSPQCGLLVMDTCEHVIEGAARVATRLLEQCRDLRILATSRRPLGVRGELAWPVPPLGLPGPNASPAEVASVPAVRLFTERASSVRPDFELDERNAEDVSAICVALDGLPLAIELAAARADVLSPRAIRDRLRDRFSLLVDGGRDAAVRQQTLRAALDWSYDLLNSAERHLFVRLSVFAGPFDLDAAAAVAGDDLGDPLVLLAGLVRQSMVSVTGDDEFRLLDTPREYGRALFAADPDRGAVYERHARFFVDVAAAAAEGIHAGKQTTSLARLRAALPNLRAAIDWSLSNGREELGARMVGSMSWFFMLEGMFTEGLAYLDRAQASPERLSRSARAGIAYGIGLLAAPLGRLQEARVASATSVELAREGGDARATADGLAALSVTEWALGDLDAAAVHQDEAIELYESIRDPWRYADILVLRARTALDQRDPSAAALLERAVPLARSLGDRHAVGMALAQLSQLKLSARAYAEAAAAATDALAAHEALHEPEATAGALHLLGRARLALGEVEEARSLHARALELAAGINHVGAICEAIEDFAAIAAHEGDPARARWLLDVARRERDERKVPLRPLEADHVRDLREAVEGALGGVSADPGPLDDPIPLGTVVEELRER